jgi:hypothetical protein
MFGLQCPRLKLKKKVTEKRGRKLLKIATDIYNSDISVHIKTLGIDTVRGFMSWG